MRAEQAKRYLPRGMVMSTSVSLHETWLALEHWHRLDGYQSILNIGTRLLRRARAAVAGEVGALAGNLLAAPGIVDTEMHDLSITLTVADVLILQACTKDSTSLIRILQSLDPAEAQRNPTTVREAVNRRVNSLTSTAGMRAFDRLTKENQTALLRLPLRSRSWPTKIGQFHPNLPTEPPFAPISNSSTPATSSITPGGTPAPLPSTVPPTVGRPVPGTSHFASPRPHSFPPVPATGPTPMETSAAPPSIETISPPHIPIGHRFGIGEHVWVIPVTTPGVCPKHASLIVGAVTALNANGSYQVKDVNSTRGNGLQVEAWRVQEYCKSGLDLTMRGDKQSSQVKREVNRQRLRAQTETRKRKQAEEDAKQKVGTAEKRAQKAVENARNEKRKRETTERDLESLVRGEGGQITRKGKSIAKVNRPPAFLFALTGGGLIVLPSLL